MNRFLASALLAASALSLSATFATTTPQAKTKDEPFVRVLDAKIKLAEGFEKATKIELGKNIEAIAKLHITEWFSAKAISGQVDVKNKTKKEIFTSYHLAFFDKKDVLLGCASQTLSFKPEDETSIAGAVIQMPVEHLQRVARYRITWYKDTQKIGSR